MVEPPKRRLSCFLAAVQAGTYTLALVAPNVLRFAGRRPVRHEPRKVGGEEVARSVAAVHGFERDEFL